MSERIILGRTVALVIGLLISVASSRVSAQQPVLSPPIWIANSTSAQITISNCANTNAQYVTQTSTNLVQWISIATNQSAPTNLSVSVPTTSQTSFYRVRMIPLPGPIFRNAIVVRSNFNINGNGVTVDSFDSSDTNYSTGGQWDLSKRKSGAIVATTASIINELSVGNGTIYGFVSTGLGTTQQSVEVGPDGEVGDLAWNAENSGIESNHWSGNFNQIYPDVAAPTFVGLPFPSPDTNGNITLNLSNANYIVPTLAGSPLIIAAPCTIWAPGLAASNNYFSMWSNTFIFTNGGSLVLYLGTSTGSGDVLSLSGRINAPGVAANLQIFGLPSLVSALFPTTGTFIGCLYAPEAAINASGGGLSPGCSGAIVAKSMSMIGHPQLHFDENLLINGPSR